MLAEALAVLEAGPIGTMARETAWLYPTANLVHLLGLVLLIGSIGVVDLRLIGLFRSLPLPALSRALTPFAICGLLFLAASGTLLFAADATALAKSSRFQLKLVLIAIALCNALLFRFAWQGEEPRLLLRLLAAASITLWLLIAALGRLIAYA